MPAACPVAILSVNILLRRCRKQVARVLVVDVNLVDIDGELRNHVWKLRGGGARVTSAPLRLIARGCPEEGEQRFDSLPITVLRVSFHLREYEELQPGTQRPSRSVCVIVCVIVCVRMCVRVSVRVL